MRVLLAVVGIVLAAPVLILVAIAFGPVALLIGRSSPRPSSSRE